MVEVKTEYLGDDLALAKEGLYKYRMLSPKRSEDKIHFFGIGVTPGAISILSKSDIDLETDRMSYALDLYSYIINSIMEVPSLAIHHVARDVNSFVHLEWPADHKRYNFLKYTYEKSERSVLKEPHLQMEARGMWTRYKNLAAKTISELRQMKITVDAQTRVNPVKITSLPCLLVETDIESYNHYPFSNDSLDERRKELVDSLLFIQINKKETRRIRLRNPIDHYEMSSVEDIKRGLWARYYAEDFDEFYTQNSRKPKKRVAMERRFRNPFIKESIEEYRKSRQNVDLGDWPLPLENFEFLHKDIDSLKVLETESISLQYYDFNNQEFMYDGDCNLVWYRMFHFLNSLVQELNVCRKNPCPSTKDFYCSKVNGYECWVFSRSTGSNNLLFYDLVYRGEEVEMLSGSNSIDLGGGWKMTRKIRSISPEGLGQLIGCIHKLICLHKYFSSRMSNFEANRMLTMSILIMLDGKQQTIDMLQYFRYLYMEQTTIMPAYGPIVEKATQFRRTRLQSAISFMMKYCVIEFIENKRINWITGEKVENLTMMLCLSYMHYIIPSKGASEMHSSVQTLYKVISEEMQLDLSRPEYCGEKVPKEELRSHEYNPKFICTLANYLVKYLRTKGVTQKRLVHDWRRLCSKDCNWFDFCTTKKINSV